MAEKSPPRGKSFQVSSPTLKSFPPLRPFFYDEGNTSDQKSPLSRVFIIQNHRRGATVMSKCNQQMGVVGMGSSLIRGLVLSALAAGMLAGSSASDVQAASPTVFGVVNMTNELAYPIKVQYAWDGYTWHTTMVQPKQTVTVAKRYSNASGNRTPRCLLAIYPVTGARMNAVVMPTTAPDKSGKIASHVSLKESYGKLTISGDQVNLAGAAK